MQLALAEDRLAGVGLAGVPIELASRLSHLATSTPSGFASRLPNSGCFSSARRSSVCCRRRTLGRLFSPSVWRAEPRKGPVACPKCDASARIKANVSSASRLQVELVQPLQARHDNGRLRRIQPLDEFAAIARHRLLREQRQERRFLPGVAPAFAHGRQHVVRRQCIEELHDVAGQGIFLLALPAFQEDAQRPAPSESQRRSRTTHGRPGRTRDARPSRDAVRRPSRRGRRTIRCTRSGQFESRFSLPRGDLAIEIEQRGGDEFRFLVGTFAGETERSRRDSGCRRWDWNRRCIWPACANADRRRHEPSMPSVRANS